MANYDIYREMKRNTEIQARDELGPRTERPRRDRRFQPKRPVWISAADGAVHWPPALFEQPNKIDFLRCDFVRLVGLIGNERRRISSLIYRLAVHKNEKPET